MLLALLVLGALPQDPAGLRIGQPLHSRLGPDALEVLTEELARKDNLSGARGQAYALSVDDPGAYTITLRSHAFDAYLVVRDGENRVVAEEDSGFVGSHARIVLQLEAGSTCRVFACTEDGSEGPFELTVDAGDAAPLPGAERTGLAVTDAREGVERMRASEGDPSAGLGHALFRLGVALRRAGHARDAVPALERALDMRAQVLGENHPATAASVTELGLALNGVGRFREAQPLLEQAVGFWEEHGGPGHVRTGHAYNDLAYNFEDLADYERARELYQQALDIWDEALGPKNIQSAVALNNLASTEQKLGDLGQAQRSFERSLALREELRGPDSLSVATVCANLGVLAADRDHYQEAVRYTRRALEIRKRELPPDHPGIHQLEANLGSHLYELGRNEEACALLASSLAGIERSVGPQSPVLLPYLSNLADGLLRLARLEEAEVYARRAMAIAGEAFGGQDHIALSRAQSSLAHLHFQQGDVRGAYEEWKVALATVEGAGEYVGMEIWIRGWLAEAAKHLGRREEAGERLARLLADVRASFGEDSALVYGVKTELLEHALDRADWDAAFELAVENFEAADAEMNAFLWAMSESSRLSYVANFYEAVGALLTVLRAEPTPERVRLVFERTLAWKGRVARSLDLSRERLTAEYSPAARARADELARAQSRLSNALHGRGSVSTEELTELLSHRDELGEELALLAEEAAAAPRVGLAQVDAALPEGAALVEFDFFHAYHRLDRPGSEWGSFDLVAFVHRQGRDGLDAVFLGAESELSALVTRFRQAILAAASGSAADVASLRTTNDELRRAIWDPLAEKLAGVELVFISPDGCLGALPFEAFQLEGGRYLVEEHAFVYLQDLGWLARGRAPGVSSEPSLLALGGVDYSRRGDLAWREGAPEPVAVALASGARDRPAASRGSASADSGSRSVTLDLGWRELSETGREVLTVEALHRRTFGTAPRLVLTGRDGTEERLKFELGRHVYVHVATHGFFQREGQLSMWADALRQGAGGEPALLQQAPVGVLPGLLSGLVCAGANVASGGRDDGLLTAEELSWLDLDGVQLVVLSACESGVGPVAEAEGMLGLRRALRGAGVDTVISSLWSVEDRSTRELMEAFYRRLWRDGDSRLEALRGAQLECLGRNRAQGGDGRPSSWAGFVLDGEWR